MKNSENSKNITDSDSMLANLDRVMRQLRRRPQGTRHATRGTYLLLRIISETPGISTKELSEMLGIRRASLNEKLIGLENEEMIRRDRDPKDQRVFVVYLEQGGTDYLARGREIRTKMHDSISKILTSEEIQNLTLLAGKLAEGLEEIDTASESAGELLSNERSNSSAD